MLFSGAALAVSIFSCSISKDSYSVSREAEDAQKENVLIVCVNALPYPKFISTTIRNTLDSLKAGWTARITNNSRSAVNIGSLFVDITKTKPDSPGSRTNVSVSYSADKYGAQYSLNDAAIYIEPEKSITVGFDEAISVSPSEVEGYDSPMAGDPLEPLALAVITLTAETSRGKRFSARCGTY
jgi:hypothetical protein